jgi:hypothetical protein
VAGTGSAARVKFREQAMPRSIREILDRADELAAGLEAYDPKAGDERHVEEYFWSEQL